MKTKMVFFAVCMACAFLGKAQFSVGVKTGVNFADAKLYFEDFQNALLPNANIISTPTAGINMQYRVTDHFSFQPEINYIQRGFQAKNRFNLMYLTFLCL